MALCLPSRNIQNKESKNLLPAPGRFCTLNRKRIVLKKEQSFFENPKVLLEMLWDFVYTLMRCDLDSVEA